MNLPEYDNTPPYADIGPPPSRSAFQDEKFVLMGFGLPALVVVCIGLFVASLFGLFN